MEELKGKNKHDWATWLYERNEAMGGGGWTG